jgi:Uma2 family endonuclease
MEALSLNFAELGGLTDDEFYRFCISNKQIRIERTAKGEIIIMPPSGLEYSSFNIEVASELRNWNKRKRLGRVFDSSGGFTLPSGAMRAPDAAFVRRERWDTLSIEEKKRFAAICPDFVIEVMSGSDLLKSSQAKMHEWMESGCQLAWLIDVEREKTYIYRADGDIAVVEGFDAILSGENVLPDFELHLTDIEWE